MNSRLQILFSRRSVRKYAEGPVSDELVRDMLEAAMAAPSAVCKDPWRFVVIRDRALLTEIAAGLPNGGFLRDAPVGIIVCGDIEAAHDRQLSYLLQDCSAAIENLLLAADALGLGACWLGIHPRAERIEHVRKIIRLPENIIPVSAIAVGRPDHKPEPRTRYDSKKVYCNGWERKASTQRAANRC